MGEFGVRSTPGGGAARAEAETVRLQRGDMAVPGILSPCHISEYDKCLRKQNR